MNTKELIELWPMPERIRTLLLSAVVTRGKTQGFLYSDGKKEGCRGPWHALNLELSQGRVYVHSMMAMTAEEHLAMTEVRSWLNEARGTGFISSLLACEPNGRWRAPWSKGQREQIQRHTMKLYGVDWSKRTGVELAV